MTNNTEADVSPTEHRESQIPGLVEIDGYYVMPETVEAEWSGKPRCLSAALKYASLGWETFPAPRGERKSHKSEKHSGTKWGKTADPDEIKRDYKRWPNANVAIACGKIWVLDADTIEGHGVDGVGNLKALEEQYGKLPLTLTALSPSCGPHYYFKQPSGVEITNSMSKIAPGIDVRGSGGMVIAPPSVKPGFDRRSYVWICNAQVADAPQWLIELVTRREVRERTFDPNDGDGDEEVDRDKIEFALGKIDSNCGYVNWRDVGAALNNTFGDEIGFEIFDPWSAKSAGLRNAKNKLIYDPHECWKAWQGFRTLTEFSVGTIYWLADAESPGGGTNTTRNGGCGT